ncbi:MAG: hypothetical protein KC516_00410 [Nanoarchaeota archaeon]|nr:hypothetical protein [Nanoarchaeota archaeon]
MGKSLNPSIEIFNGKEVGSEFFAFCSFKKPKLKVGNEVIEKSFGVLHYGKFEGSNKEIYFSMGYLVGLYKESLGTYLSGALFNKSPEKIILNNGIPDFLLKDESIEKSHKRWFKKASPLILEEVSELFSKPLLSEFRYSIYNLFD